MVVALAVNGRELLSVAVTDMERVADGIVFTGTTKSSVAGLRLKRGASETFRITLTVGELGGVGVVPGCPLKVTVAVYCPFESVEAAAAFTPRVREVGVTPVVALAVSQAPPAGVMEVIADWKLKEAPLLVTFTT